MSSEAKERLREGARKGARNQPLEAKRRGGGTGQKVKSCGKAHPACNVCRPGWGAKVGAGVRRRHQEDPSYRDKISKANRRRFRDPAERARSSADNRRRRNDRHEGRGYPPGHTLWGGRWWVYLWNGDQVRRAVFMWCLAFGLSPDDLRGFQVHHLDDSPEGTLRDWPLRDTLAMPRGHHWSLHAAFKRYGRFPQGILNRWDAYWRKRALAKFRERAPTGGRRPWRGLSRRI